MGADATAPKKSSETMSSDTATMMPERSTVSESVKTTATVSPTENEIAIPRCDTRTESKMKVELRWKGHWEVWEMEWSEPRWVWDDLGYFKR